MPPSPDSAVSAQFRVARVLHAAMVSSLVVYAVIVYALRVVGWSTAMGAVQVATLRWLLHGLGAAALVAVLVLKGRLLAAEAVGETARRAGAAAALATLQTRLVILMAVGETAAILGLILFLLTAELTDFIVLWIAALLGLLAVTPRRELWDEVARSAGRPV